MTVAGGGISQTVNVTQTGVETFLTISPASLNLGPNSGSIGTFSVSSNVNWSVNDDASWLSITPFSGSNNGTVTVMSSSANSSSSSRSATVSITGGGLTRTAIVTQNPNISAVQIYVNGATYNSFLSASGEQWYYFETSLAGDYTIETHGTTDTRMNLYMNDHTTLIASDDDGGEGTASKIEGSLAANMIYFVKIEGNNSSTSGSYSIDIKGPTTTGLDNIQKNFPSKYDLAQNYPNPFNPNTNIEFSLPTSGFVSLKVYTLLGVEVMSLVDGYFTAGVHKIDWNAEHLPNGIYLYVLLTGNFHAFRKAILMK